MMTYDLFVNTILKLQSCYRVAKILEKELVSKLDLYAKPHVGIAIGVALWAYTGFRQHTLSYPDMIYIERRLAAFLQNAPSSELEVLYKLLDLMPPRRGLEINTVATRCMIDLRTLLDIVNAMNVISESLHYIQGGARIEEPIRRDKRLCMSDSSLLPPAHANAQTYLELCIKALLEDERIARDPLMNNIVEVIADKVSRGDRNPDDFAAAALIMLIIARKMRDAVVCAEPCVNIEAYARRIYNDLASLGADAQRSEIYDLYNQLLMRSALM